MAVTTASYVFEWQRVGQSDSKSDLRYPAARLRKAAPTGGARIADPL